MDGRSQQINPKWKKSLLQRGRYVTHTCYPWSHALVLHVWVGHGTMGLKGVTWYRQGVLCKGCYPRPKMVTKSFGKRNFMQPMGRPKHALKVPCFFSFYVLGFWGGGVVKKSTARTTMISQGTVWVSSPLLTQSILKISESVTRSKVSNQCLREQEAQGACKKFWTLVKPPMIRQVFLCCNVVGKLIC